MDRNDRSWENIPIQRNKYQQNQLANEISSTIEQLNSFVTSTLNLHLNLGQNSQINTSEVFMSMETLSTQSLSNKSISSIGNARIHLPDEIKINDSIDSLSLRVSHSD